MAKFCGYPDYKAALQSADAILCALDDLYLCELQSYDSDFSLSLVDRKHSESQGATVGRRLAVSGRGDELRAANALLMLTRTDHDMRRAPPRVQQAVQQNPSKLETVQQSRTQFGTLQQSSSQTGETNRNSQHRSVQWKLAQTTKVQQNHSQTRMVQCSSTQTVAVRRNPPKHQITKANTPQPKPVQSYTTQTRSTQQTVSHTQARRQGVSQSEIAMWNPVEVFVQHGFPHSELRRWRRPKTKNTHGSSQKEATQQTAARTAPKQDKHPQTKAEQPNSQRTPILQQALSPEQENCPQTEWEDVDVVMVPINEVVQHLAHQEETIPLQVHTYIISALLQQLYRKVLAQCKNGTVRQLMLERSYESYNYCYSGNMRAAISETNPESKEYREKSKGAGNTVTFGNSPRGRYNERSSGVQEVEGCFSTENRTKRREFGFFQAGPPLSSYGVPPQQQSQRKLSRSSSQCNRHTEDMLHLLMVLSAALQLFGDSETRNPMPEIFRCLRANYPPQKRSTAVSTEGLQGNGEGGQQQQQYQQQSQQQKKQRCAIKNKKQEQEKGGDSSGSQNIISHPDNTFPGSGHAATRASSGAIAKESDALKSSSSKNTMPSGRRGVERKGKQQNHSFAVKDRNKEENRDNSGKRELGNSHLSTLYCSSVRDIKAEQLDKILRAAESTILVCADCGPKPKRTRRHEMVRDSQQAAQKGVMDGKHQENSGMPLPQDHCCDEEPGELYLIVPVQERIEELCKMSVETLIEEGVIAVVDRSHQQKSCKHAETTTAPQVPQLNTTESGARTQGSSCTPSPKITNGSVRLHRTTEPANARTQGSSCTPPSKITSGSSRPHHNTEPANGQHRENDPRVKQTRATDARVPRGNGPVSSSSVGGNPPTEEKKEPVTTDPYEMLMQALERRAVALRKGRYRRRAADTRAQHSGAQNVCNTENHKDTLPVKPASQ
ncbi:uncharacterized protein LOC126470391 isoform X1 [Schistocerca serialis cubense]|uniref:uncharacterized protein LOC126470391 isoform X1 n=1 Tax=Schistocerca serialis cubense TaxID=2023355 RepID=UPI00214F11C1|nr:uncharacterized protein LOC126470391 isoform X1 [Schistocerca serialis cubense]XP_049954190.1 uncharacterized protein LOC126470391 isoform X1 [Schistocerca serialis cubense]XP_049954191.1 uncharacterized protein LOC126470391 isoform X1 [Schistocerca serialis cubense]